MQRSYSLALALAALALAGVLSLTTSAWARTPRPGFDRMSRLEEKLDALTDARAGDGHALELSPPRSAFQHYRPLCVA